MAVTAFDGTFSFRQEELAKMGGVEPQHMTPEQWQEFLNSPFMKSMQKADEVTYIKTMEREAKRKERDPEFDPQDSDWTAPKTFDYDKHVNYYKVIGTDDLASLAEIKQAYKKLSLIFHPDKTAGMTQKEKDEHNATFIEIKNAYKTVSDQATRRQYDRERDKDLAVQEVNGWKVKQKQSFDATELLKKLQEDSKTPGKVLELPMKFRLEKFFWGGHKAITRERKVKDFVGFQTEKKTFRLDVPPGAPEDLALVFPRAGDHQEEAQPDTLKFVISSKPHDAVERQGGDLVVRKSVCFKPDAYASPHVSGQVESIRGRHIVFWGRNPFYRTVGSGTGELRFRLQGEGLPPEGALRFTAQLGARANTEETIVVRLRQLTTGAELAMRLPKAATMGDAREKARELLGLRANQDLKIQKATAGRYETYPDEQAIKTLRSLDCGGFEWKEVPLSPEAAKELLHIFAGIVETEAFQASLAEAYKLCETDRTEAMMKVNAVWQTVSEALPDFGFDQSLDALKKLLTRVLKMLESDSGTAAIRESCSKVPIGFSPTAYAKLETRGHRPHGKTKHPLMAQRIKERLAKRAICEVELSPMFSEPVQMYTKPACSLTFYSNARQAAAVEPGFLRPRLLFAVAISCPTGAKKSGLPEWLELKEKLAPLLLESFFCLMPIARGTLPRALAPASAFPEQDYSIEEDAVAFKTADDFAKHLAAVAEGGEDDDEEDDDEEEEEEEKDDDDDDGGGGGMFDFDDMDDDDEKVQKKKEKEERKRRKRESRQAIRMELRLEHLAEERRKAAMERAAKLTPGAATPVPWMRLGDQAFERGDFYLAANFYSKQLEEVGDGDCGGKASILVNRSACLAKVEHFNAALEDAKAAVELKGTWGRAWSAVGLAAASHGEEMHGEACEAYFKAVQCEPTGSNIDELFSITRLVSGRDVEKANADKDSGNAALKLPDMGLAIAHYTRALAQVPEEEAEVDPHANLKGALYCNRSLAFANLRSWDAAVSDGQQAVAVAGVMPRARVRLGTALLGVGLHEQAYAEFAMGLRLQPDDVHLRQSLDACLNLMPLWRSVPAMVRLRTRFLMDAKRPRGSSKVYAMSDLHYDHKKNDEWVHNIDEFMFQEDVLIVAGNVGDTLSSVVRCLRALKMKFRRVFFTPGNHEFWIHPSEKKKFADSFAKFHAILMACDELGVDVFPAAITEDCSIAPMFSWYNAEFDEADPFPDPKLSFDSHCRWPMDVEEQLWKFFLHLNSFLLKLPSYGTLLTFSHFLPRQGLPFDKAAPKISKVMGCEQLDEQIRNCTKSKLHVYGHSRKKFAKSENGITYISHALGYENEHTDKEPIMCVFNGQSACSRPVPICVA